MSAERNPEGYEVDDRGMIVSPGKFEGEMLYVPFYWNADGADDEIYDGETLISVYRVSAEDRATFPELADVDVVTLWESDNGFVFSDTWTTAAWQAAEDRLNAAADAVKSDAADDEQSAEGVE